MPKVPYIKPENRGPKLLLHVNLWNREQPFLTAKHAGKLLPFTKTEEARTFAAANGYNGVRLTCEDLV